MGNQTIELCDRIISEIEARREVQGWLAQARRQAEYSLQVAQIRRDLSERELRARGWFRLAALKGGV